MLQTFHIGRHGRNCFTTVSANYEQMHNDQQTIQYTKIKTSRNGKNNIFVYVNRKYFKRSAETPRRTAIQRNQHLRAQATKQRRKYGVYAKRLDRRHHG